MKYRDTTDPTTYRALFPLFTDQTLTMELEKSANIGFRIVGLYHSLVGPEWSSHGREQSDYFHYLHFVCGGNAEICHQGRPFHLQAGQVYWLSGNTPVVRVSANRYETYVLKFRCEVTGGADLLLDWPGRGPRRLGTWNRKKWEGEWNRKPITTNAWLALHGQLCLWMSERFPDLDSILAHYNQTFARFPNALKRLELRLGADLRIQELAEAQGTTLHAFSVAFERHIGLSPKAYLNRRLNQEACRLLINTDWRIKEVARKLSFGDEFYFSRFFSKMNGISPGQYRRRFDSSRH